MSIRLLCWGISLAVLLQPTLAADGPLDNQVNAVRPIPPPGIAIDDAVRAELIGGLQKLESAISALGQSKNESMVRYIPDVAIIAKALRIALFEDGFFEKRDVESARKLLAEGMSRAEWLKTPLTSPPHWSLVEKEGATIRGYRSRIDGSIQPYGVAWTDITSTGNQRADVWCRGRSEKGLELQFLAQHLQNPNPKPVRPGFFVYPMGRYCNANKLAGEIDTLEVLEHATKEYNLDPSRTAIRGFSMGGAAAWHLAVHYPDKWFAATPGAGFSETPLFLKAFQSEELTPTDYEKTLWKLYDCPGWAINLKNVPTIAYSGEIDKQKQAADVMAEACWNLPDDLRFELTHIVAPQTAHKISPEARDEIESKLDDILKSQNSKPRTPVWFTTYTLKYNRCFWLTIDRLVQHWTQATIWGEISTRDRTVNVTVQPRGILEFSIDFRADELPQNTESLDVYVVDKDNKVLHRETFGMRSDRSWNAKMRYNESTKNWSRIQPLEASSTLRKKHDLQGPIDDAFMGPFLFVKPTAQGLHPALDKWVEAEFERAIREWHRQMRGDVKVVDPKDLKETDSHNYNLVLWGDPVSNSKIAQLLPKLPIKWDSQNLIMGTKSYASSGHIPVMIYPNPEAPNRYVVLNSSFTYREYDYLNNARQVPKLPDWAVVDATSIPDARWPGKVLQAGFFGEAWDWKKGP